MKTSKFLFQIFSTLLLTITIATLTQAQEGAPILSADAFEAATKKNKKAVILDIRTPKEVSEGHIADAAFIDFMADDFEQKLQGLNKKKTYYVYCRSAKRTIPATEKMKELGFKKVYMLEGGLNNWLSSGKEIVKKED
jgi:rhodanese-related sulfurtransferase